MNITILDIIVILGIIGAVIRYAILNSKCSDISFCCGLVSIKRDTKAELELQEAELDAGIDISGGVPETRKLERKAEHKKQMQNDD